MPAPRGLSREYVELQLRFAERFTILGLCDLEHAVLRYTTFFRRFGFGSPDAADTNDDWIRYSSTLVGLPTLAEQTAWTAEFAETLDAPSAAAHDKVRCGPFSGEVCDGVLRTHFMPHDDDGLSPLDESKRERRRAELRTIVDMARDRHPGLVRVRGESWLYNTRSYRALFPPAHVATAHTRTGTTRFQGSSAWGQFLDHRGDVKASLRATFLTALDRFDGSEPWRVFPLPTLIVDSPIEVFDHDRR